MAPIGEKRCDQGCGKKLPGCTCQQVLCEQAELQMLRAWADLKSLPFVQQLQGQASVTATTAGW